MATNNQLYVADFRVLGAVCIEFDDPGLDYLSRRQRLSEQSWRVVDVARRNGFYCDIVTFPGWENSDEMLDFGWMHEHFPLNGFDTFCFRLNGSPIADSSELDEERVTGTARPDIRKLRKLAPLPTLQTINSGDLRNIVKLDDQSTLAYRKSPFAQCLSDIFSTQYVQSGFLLCSENYSADSIQELRADEASLLFWLAALLYPDEEFATNIVK